jgi:hypothetical protein
MNLDENICRYLASKSCASVASSLEQKMLRTRHEPRYLTTWRLAWLNSDDTDSYSSL